MTGKATATKQELRGLKINPEYEKVFDPLPEDEFEALVESIKQNGQYYPIVVNSEGVILDGHQRTKACDKLGIPVKGITKTHTATSGTITSNEYGKIFDSGYLSKGKSFTFVFDQPGEFEYFCLLHPNMIGKIVVSE